MHLWTWLRTRLHHKRPSTPKTGRKAAKVLFRPALEHLEDRIAPAVALTYGGPGTVLSLTEGASGATPSITLSDSGTNTLTINLNGGHFDAGSTAAASGLAYSTAGNPGASTSATIDISAANSITSLVTALAGDALTLGTIADNNGGVGNINAAANTISILGGDTVNTSNATAGAGNISLNASTSLTLNTGSTVEAKDGSITLQANQGASPAGGNFIGINDNGGTVETTGLGAIVLQGRGGTDAATGNHIGVLIQGGGQVLSTGTGAVTINGSGGTGAQLVSGNLTSQDTGVQITDLGSEVSSASGAISVTGTGASGPGELNAGVFVLNGARIASTGTGSSAATITITGSGGSGSSGGTPNVSANYGVIIATAVNNNPAEVTSVDGAIRISGTGGSGTGDFDLGVGLFGGSLVQATGAAPITIQGTGGTGANENYGVAVWDTNGDGARVGAATGAIHITGQGGQGSGGSNMGVLVLNGGQVTSTGTGAGVGTVTLQGSGGSGTDDNDGVDVEGGSSRVTSVAGAINLTGTGGNASGVRNIGVRVITGGKVTSTGTGAAAASISITGTGGNGTSDADGVDVNGSGGVVTSQGGAINVSAALGSGSGNALRVTGGTISTAGAGALTLSAAQDVLLTGGSTVSTADGSLTILANQGPAAAAGNFVGINVNTATVTSTGAGAIVLRGRGGDDSASNAHLGIEVSNGGKVLSAGTGSVTLQGTGGTGTGLDNGVEVTNTGSLVSSVNGAIAITGTGGQGSSTFNLGVVVSDGGQVTSTGTGAGAAPITITGTGGAGTGSNYGVDVEGAHSLVTSVNGAITLTGFGGKGSGDNNEGVLIHTGGEVSSTGTTATAAPITITGTGGTGGSSNYGVSVEDSTTVVTSVTGALAIVGTGGRGSGTNNSGILVQTGAHVTSTGSGAGAASLTLQGTGGTGTASEQGVDLEGPGTALTSQGGAIQVSGTRGSGPGNAVLVNNSTISAAGAGTVALTATQNLVVSAGATVSTADGTLTILANQGPTPQNGSFIGIQVNGATVQTTAAGNLVLVGRGGNDPSTSGHIGVLVNGGGIVQATGTGSISVSGTGGSGTNTNFGVYLSDTNTAVKAASGPIAITGVAGTASTAVNVVSSAHVSGTSAIPITLTGDSMSFAGSPVLNSAGGVITLQPFTAGTPIHLGGTSSPAVLVLDPSALNNDFNTGALHIGNSTAGTLSVLDAIAPSLTSTLALITGAGITSSGPGALTIANLRTSSSGAVSLTGANVVGTLAGQVTGAGPFVFNDNHNGLTVGQVEGVNGITTAGGNVVLTVAGKLVLGTGAGAGESITAPGGIVDLKAAGVMEAGPSIISADGLRLQGNGTFTLTGPNAVTTLAGSFNGPLMYTSAGTLTIGPLLGTPGLASGNSDITLGVSTGDLMVHAPVQAGTGTVDVTYTGTLVGIGGAPIAAAKLAVHGGTGVGSTFAPLNTGLGLLAVNVGNGGVFIANAGNLAIDTVHGLSGVTATGGAITISTTGNLTVNQPVTTATTAGNDITLSGNGALGLFAPLTGSSATVQGGPGDDTFTVHTTLPTPVSVVGAAGNNTLVLEASSHPIYTSLGRYVQPGQQPLSYGSFSTIQLMNAASVSTFYGPDTVDRSTALAGLTPDERFVQVLYLDALGRAGTKAELDAWVNVLNGPGGSQAVVANALERSAEARGHLVQTWYLTYLGRAAQPVEEQGWANALLAGQTEETVLSNLLSGQEFYQRAPTITGDGGAPSDQEYVKALYLVLLNRAPTSTELSEWVSAVSTVGRAGVASNLQTSEEGRNDRIDAIYNALLHRPGDSRGLALWVATGLDLTTIRVDVELTPEFYYNG